MPNSLKFAATVSSSLEVACLLRRDMLSKSYLFIYLFSKNVHTNHGANALENQAWNYYDYDTL